MKKKGIDILLPDHVWNPVKFLEKCENVLPVRKFTVTQANMPKKGEKDKDYIQSIFSPLPGLHLCSFFFFLNCIFVLFISKFRV